MKKNENSFIQQLWSPNLPLRYATNMKNIRILVADDHPIVAEAVKSHLGKYPGFNVCATVCSSTEIFAKLTEGNVDVLVTDYSMPGGVFGDGLTMLRRLRDRYPDVRIVVFTSIDSPGIIAALESNGFHAIVHKRDDTDELIFAINRVLRGDGYLSPGTRQAAHHSDTINVAGALSNREVEVLRMYLAGSNVSEIAIALKRSAKTINNQKRAAMAKLFCKTDAELFKLQAIGAINAEDHMSHLHGSH